MRTAMVGRVTWRRTQNFLVFNGGVLLLALDVWEHGARSVWRCEEKTFGRTLREYLQFISDTLKLLFGDEPFGNLLFLCDSSPTSSDS